MMRRSGFEAIYPKPCTSNRIRIINRYLFKGVTIDISYQAWCAYFNIQRMRRIVFFRKS
ncbi:MAG: hypothetical protein ACFFDN_34705 [Candidatus Hodarchaeota archaeon]